MSSKENVNGVVHAIARYSGVGLGQGPQPQLTKPTAGFEFSKLGIVFYSIATARTETVIG